MFWNIVHVVRANIIGILGEFVICVITIGDFY